MKFFFWFKKRTRINYIITVLLCCNYISSPAIASTCVVFNKSQFGHLKIGYSYFTKSYQFASIKKTNYLSILVGFLLSDDDKKTEPTTIINSNTKTEQKEPVQITILSTWNRIWIANIVLLLFVIAIVFLIRRYNINQKRIENNIELLKKKIDQENINKVSNFISIFNVSHELKKIFSIPATPNKELINKIALFCSPETKKNHTQVNRQSLVYILSDNHELRKKKESKYSDSKNSGSKILIVENNPYLRDYLEDLLSVKYTVQTAIDGNEGFNKAIEQQPDIIISNILIPETDGFELCLKLKKNINTQLIPIILLTTNPNENQEIFGLKVGADELISNLNNPELLLLKVSNILYARKMLEKKYCKKIHVSGTEIEITPFDEKLIKNCIKIIENNFLNSKLNAYFLADKLNLSNSSLYRKLKAATGCSVNQFIRKIRLDRAIQLMDDHEKTISEIAFEVGFNDQKYFRDCFVKEFGIIPSKYRKNKMEKILIEETESVEQIFS